MENELILLGTLKETSCITDTYFAKYNFDISKVRLQEGETIDVKKVTLEELIDFVQKPYFTDQNVEKEKDIENYFHCEIIEGTPRLGGEELEIMTDSNYYEPMYMDINELKNKNFQRMDVVNKAINKKYE